MLYVSWLEAHRGYLPANWDVHYVIAWTHIDAYSALAFAMALDRGRVSPVFAAAALKENVARYSQLARQRNDEGFGKDPKLMFTIEKPPFFAIPQKSHLLVTLGGLNIDPRMRVLDKKICHALTSPLTLGAATSKGSRLLQFSGRIHRNTPSLSSLRIVRRFSRTTRSHDDFLIIGK